MIEDPHLMFKIAELTLHSLNGMLDEQGLSQLEELLEKNPIAVDYYQEVLWSFVGMKSMDGISCLQEVDHSSLDNEFWRAMLQEEKDAPMLEIPEENASRELVQKVIYPHGEPRQLSKFNVFTFIVSAAAVLFIVLFMKYVPQNKSVYEVATLNAAVGTRWSDSVSLSESGDRVCASETFSLAEGLVEIKTDNDVDLIIEGPAEFDFTKEGDMRLGRGKVYAVVSAQGIGFTVTTPTSKIIDLGTEFGVQAGGTGSTETHVYKGKVTLLAGSSPLEKQASAVTAGQARLIHTDGSVNHKPIDEHLFVRKEEFMVNVRASQGSSYDRWLAYSYKLRRNPDLVAYYTFEKDESQPDVLANKAIGTEGRLDGNLYSALNGPLPSWVDGRWSQKTALHFNRSDRQVVVVPSDKAVQINGPITIAAWVRCSMPKEGGHIVSCRLPNGDGNYQFGYKSPREEDEWTGKLQFARICYESNIQFETDRIFSEQTFTISPQWRFVAVTHDNKTVKMYVDGRFIETHDFVFQQEPFEADLVIGADRVEGDPTRFKGDMDELMIFNRVLNADEIHEIYQAGKPGSY